MSQKIVNIKTYSQPNVSFNELTLEQWEQIHRKDLNILYKQFFVSNKKIECTYDEFVFYAYEHSNHYLPTLSSN
jgi:hypothetical protein